MSQEDLAGRVGTDQPTVSKWEREEQTPSLTQIAAIDVATGRRLGAVLIAAGYVDGLDSVDLAIAADRELTDRWREYLLNAYQAALKMSRDETRNSLAAGQ